MIQLTADDTAALLELRKVSKRKSDAIRRRDRLIAGLREELQFLTADFNRSQVRREEMAQALRDSTAERASLNAKCDQKFAQIRALTDERFALNGSLKLAEASKLQAERLAEKRHAALRVADVALNKANRMVIFGCILGRVRRDRRVAGLGVPVRHPLAGRRVSITFTDEARRNWQSGSIPVLSNDATFLDVQEGVDTRAMPMKPAAMSLMMLSPGRNAAGRRSRFNSSRCR